MTSLDVDPNAPATFPDWLSHQAERRGPQVALRQKLRGIWASWSWRALDEDVSRMQQALAARGLVPGDRIVIHSDLIQSGLCPEVIVLGLAAQRGGAAVTFVETVAGGAQPEPAARSERGSTLAPAPWPRFVVVRDVAALAELPPEPAPAFELRILLTGRGFVPGAQPGVVLYEALLRERRGRFASSAESGPRPRGAREGDVACVVSPSARGQSPAASAAQARTHGELIAAAGAIARSLGDDADHDAIALGSAGWQFCNVIGPWLLLGFRLNLVENAATADYDRRELGPSLLLGTAGAYRDLAERVLASLPPPGSWLRRALDRLLDARSGSLSAWLRAWLVLRPLRDVLGVARVRRAFVLGAPPEPALSSELRRLGIAVEVPVRADVAVAGVASEPPALRAAARTAAA